MVRRFRADRYLRVARCEVTRARRLVAAAGRRTVEDLEQLHDGMVDGQRRRRGGASTERRHREAGRTLQLLVASLRRRRAVVVLRSKQVLEAELTEGVGAAQRQRSASGDAVPRRAQSALQQLLGDLGRRDVRRRTCPGHRHRRHVRLHLVHRAPSRKRTYFFTDCSS